MEQKTMYVTRTGHPDDRVLINEADFDPETETKWEPAADVPASPHPNPLPEGEGVTAKAEKPAKAKRAA